MATSGKIDGIAYMRSGNATPYYDFWCYWTQNSWKSSTNTSNITVKLIIACTGFADGAWNLEEKPDVSLSVGGTARTPTISHIDTRNYATCTFATWTGDVSHNDDGTPNCDIVASFTHHGSTSLASGTLSGSANLDTIPLKSIPTLVGVPARMGDVVTINTNRRSTKFTHTLTYELNGSTGTIATGVGESYSWTVPDLASKINNATSGTCTITCETYNGTSKVGDSASVTFTLSVYAASVPTAASTAQMGTALTITTNRKSSNFTHTLKYTFGGTTTTLTTGINNSYSWTVPDLVAKIPNATSGTCTITCETYNGTAKVGSNTVNVTLTVPGASVPTLSASSVVMGNELVITTTRKSNHFTNTLKYTFGGTTTTITTSAGDVTYWQVPDLASKINNATSGVCTITCETYNGTAKIGSHTVTVTISVYPASAPTLSAGSVVMGNALTITTNRKTGNFTHTLKYTLNGSTGTIATSVGASYTWTIPDLASKINNATSGKCTITCETYNGSAKVGSATVDVTLSVQATTPVTASSGTVKMGSSVTLSCSRKSSNFTHKLTYSIGGHTGTIGTGVATSTSWTPSKDLASYTSNKASATCTITCTTYNGTAAVGTSTATLTLTVPNATVPTIAVSTVSLGDSLSIELPRETSAYDHEVLITMLKYGTTTVARETSFSSRFTTHVVWSPIPYSMAKYVPTDTKATMTFTCITYFKDSTVEVGRNTVSVTVTIPDNDTTKPTVSMTLSPSSNLGSTYSGLYIQNKTAVKAAFTGSTSYSTISGYRLTVEGASNTGNPATSNVLTTSGTLTVTGRATDARGYYRETTSSIEVIPYSPPRVIPGSGKSSIICERSNSNGVSSPNGEYLHIVCGRKFSTVTSGGVQKNYCKLEYRVKEASAADFPDKWTELISRTSTGNYVEKTVGGIIQSAITTYTVQIRAVDDVGEVTMVSITLSAAGTPLHLGEGGKNVGIGQYCDYSDSERVDVGWPMFLNAGIGKHVIFEASSGGWGEGEVLNDIFPDADTSKFLTFSLFLAIIKNTTGSTDLMYPLLLARGGNRLFGDATVPMLGSDAMRSVAVYISRDSSNNLTLVRSRMMSHLVSGSHGSATVLSKDGTSDHVLMTALYALI